MVHGAMDAHETNVSKRFAEEQAALAGGEGGAKQKRVGWNDELEEDLEDGYNKNNDGIGIGGSGSNGSTSTSTSSAETGSAEGYDLWSPSYVMLLIGGGNQARVDVLQACRRGWDVVVFQGTGGLADEIASRLEKENAEDHREAMGIRAAMGMYNQGGQMGGMGVAGSNEEVKDVVVEEIISIGKIALVSVDNDSTEDVASLIRSRLDPVSDMSLAAVMDREHHGTGKSKNTLVSMGLLTGKGGGDGDKGKVKIEPSGSTSESVDTDKNLLLHAWKRFAEYKETAAKIRRTFLLLEGCLMGLALFTTLLVALDSDIRYNTDRWGASQRELYLHGSGSNNSTTVDTRSGTSGGGAGSAAVLFFIGLAPILISVVLAVKNRFNFLAKYIALQEASSTIKREIYKYRTSLANPRSRKMTLPTARRTSSSSTAATGGSSTPR
jgi:hypothetical protein